MHAQLHSDATLTQPLLKIDTSSRTDQRTRSAQVNHRTASTRHLGQAVPTLPILQQLRSLISLLIFVDWSLLVRVLGRHTSNGAVPTVDFLQFPIPDEHVDDVLDFLDTDGAGFDVVQEVVGDDPAVHAGRGWILVAGWVEEIDGPERIWVCFGVVGVFVGAVFAWWDEVFNVLRLRWGGGVAFALFAVDSGICVDDNRFVSIVADQDWRRLLLHLDLLLPLLHPTALPHMEHNDVAQRIDQTLIQITRVVEAAASNVIARREVIEHVSLLSRSLDILDCLDQVAASELVDELLHALAVVDAAPLLDVLDPYASLDGLFDDLVDHVFVARECAEEFGDFSTAEAPLAAALGFEGDEEFGSGEFCDEGEKAMAGCDVGERLGGAEFEQFGLGEDFLESFLAVCSDAFAARVECITLVGDRVGGGHGEWEGKVEGEGGTIDRSLGKMSVVL